MLAQIIDSQDTGEVLSFFLAAPRRAFSINEVATRLSLSHVKAAVELNKLTQAKLLKSFSKQGKKYFLVNGNHPLLPELNAKFGRGMAGYKDELFLAVKSVGEVKAAYLSGLFCGQPHLPVDLLIVGRVDLRKMADFLQAAEEMMGQEINYSIMTPEEFEIRRGTFDKFIKDIFDYPHLTVFDNLTKKSR